ncbi:sporulation protein YqfC [Paenibacillus aquistagni]|uniref:Sporulation protein YqfC n=1 Tax=Paenibacillus aquistagni TaxID=1852522 RepID=A0A1X7IDZ0_9BACL|nr:sporulation protein YqfC [Paenibacillus aquistagni]NMM51514.1 sporulation protein YqfC [Paenibacillus aquistagni]SMG12674.1 sporulation protein YqfC [Paenibacillus aquistagni]
MSRFTRKVRQWTAQLFDLPQEMMLEVPRLSMIGNRQLFIENHRGVIHFSSELMRLALSAGELEVRGQNLVIKGIWTEEVFIEGDILEVKLHGMEGQWS